MRMDIVSQTEFEDGRELPECESCQDTGSVSVPNGSDDFDQEFCNCPAGERLQLEESRAEAYDQYEPHFNPLSAADALRWFNA